MAATEHVAPCLACLERSPRIPSDLSSQGPLDVFWVCTEHQEPCPGALTPDSKSSSSSAHLQMGRCLVCCFEIL